MTPSSLVNRYGHIGAAHSCDESLTHTAVTEWLIYQRHSLFPRESQLTKIIVVLFFVKKKSTGTHIVNLLLKKYIFSC
jgi:hypothetical protein